METLSSADIAILSKVVDLAYRFGLRAADADAHLSYDGDLKKMVLAFHSSPENDIKRGKFGQLLTSLGCLEDGIIRTDNTWQMEDLLDDALRKAPRIRERG